MAETKFTPGPWKVGKKFHASSHNQKVIPIEWSSVPCGTCGKSSGNWLIGWLFSHSLPLKQQEANARLIASAPDLLEALRIARTRWLEAARNAAYWTPEEMSDFEKVRAAIAKAGAQ